MDKEYAQYLLTKTREDYNLIADDFSRTRLRIWPELESLLDKYFFAGEKILDLGCGNGRFYDYFKKRNMVYFGVDGSEKLVELAKKMYPEASFEIANALNLPFSDNFFDKIASIAVLHHIPSRELRVEFLKEASRTLKAGGLIFLTVWSFKGRREFFLIWKSFISKIFGSSKMDFGDFFESWADKTERYYHYFRKKELIGLARESGFKVVESGVSRNERGNRRNVYLVLQK